HLAAHSLPTRRPSDLAGPRTSRHLSSGLKIEIESAERARGTSVCVTFAADGLPPLSPAIPTLVADFEDLYVKCTDGRWRIKERQDRKSTRLNSSHVKI